MSIRFLEPGREKYYRTRINNDREFSLAGKYMTQNILIKAGDRHCLFKVWDGIMTAMILNPSPMESWDFFIQAPAESWEIFLQPLPPPFYHSLFGASIREDFKFGGDIEAMFAHYWAVQRMLAVMREMQNE